MWITWRYKLYTSRSLNTNWIIDKKREKRVIDGVAVVLMTNENDKFNNYAATTKNRIFEIT